jgi:hypothetical protein
MSKHIAKEALCKKHKDMEKANKISEDLLSESDRLLSEARKDDFYALQGIKLPTKAVVSGMEIACLMLDHRPKKTDCNKTDNDAQGYFETAKR